MAPNLKLPDQIATKSDLIAVIRNLEEVLDNYIENGVRFEEGVDFQSQSEVSSNLAQIVAENNLEVSIEVLRSLLEWLNSLKSHAPVIRFTLSSDPTPEIKGRLATWLRQATGQFVLIRVGIQPTIAGGCYIYTPAKRYDFTLRQHILRSGPAFKKALDKIAGPAPQKQTKAPDQITDSTVNQAAEPPTQPPANPPTVQPEEPPTQEQPVQVQVQVKPTAGSQGETG